MKTIAKFVDKFGKEVLSGFVKVKKPKASDIIIPDDCDLDTREKYYYDRAQKAFIPLGTSYGKPDRCEVTLEEAIYLLMDALLNEAPIPNEVKKYVEWYKTNIQKRDIEARSWRNKQ